MTIRAEAEVQIARGLEAVWGELAAIERYPEWQRASGIAKVERLTPGPLKPGAPLRIEQRLPGGGGSALEGAVSVWEPPRRFAFKARNPDGITVEAEASLAPDEATTWVRWRVEVNLPLRLRLFESLAVPEVRRAAAEDLFALKRRMEQVAG